MRFFTGIPFIILFLFIGSLLHAQDEMVIDTSKNIILLKETTGGIMLHTQGWGLRFSKGYNKSEFKKRMIVVEFLEMQSPRQIRTINPYFTNSKSYVYGKLNAVYILRGSYGIHRLLNRKPYWGGVELRFFYMGGVSLGFAKPVYLYILKPSPQFYEYTIVEERYDPNQHYVDNIYGRAPFVKGFDEIGFYPGIHTKIGLDFDYGVYRTKVKSLEVGAIVDIFPRPLPIMAFNDPDYYFLTFYLSFNFGKRYN
jgi:TM2 domain-containing membrane protein YozV